MGEHRHVDTLRKHTRRPQPPRGAPPAVHQDMAVTGDDHLSGPAAVWVRQGAARAEEDDFKGVGHECGSRSVEDSPGPLLAKAILRELVQQLRIATAAPAQASGLARAHRGSRSQWGLRPRRRIPEQRLGQIDELRADVLAKALRLRVHPR